MPEWGMLPIPLKLVKAGVRDMVRISDARMSGTSYGACILHVAPEAYVGGPFAFVRTGDTIELDVAARRPHLDVKEARSTPEIVPYSPTRAIATVAWLFGPGVLGWRAAVLTTFRAAGLLGFERCAFPSTPGGKPGRLCPAWTRLRPFPERRVCQAVSTPFTPAHDAPRPG